MQHNAATAPDPPEPQARNIRRYRASCGYRGEQRTAKFMCWETVPMNTLA